METDGYDEVNVRSVQVRFVTKLPPPLKVQMPPIGIPSNVTRLGLSTIVNNLIKSGNPGWEPEPFDFLINDELVRMSLEEFLILKGISAEKILEIEYIKAVAPRKQELPSLHDDWVSSVDGSDSRFILTGCYDGLGRIWRDAGTCTHILDGHAGAITSVCNIGVRGSDDNCRRQEWTTVKSRATGSESADQRHIVTASKDRTLRLWKVVVDQQSNNPARITAFKILRGHNASVQCVSSQPSGNMVCSGSWDSTINLWQTNEPDAGDTVSVKKRKTVAAKDDLQAEGGALSTFVGHTQSVSSVVWPDDETIYSASWDHSIRRWDAESGKETWSMFCGKVLNGLDIGGESSALIAAGASDNILRIWDPRIPGTLSPIYQFSSHTNWVSSCKWHKKSWFHLISTSYDGKVMLWDLRTAWPLSIIDSHKDKVLCADWWKDENVVSGGADSQLCIASGISV